MIGLSRHIDQSGCYAYIIKDEYGGVRESKFFNQYGLPVPTDSIPYDFLYWIGANNKAL